MTIPNFQFPTPNTVGKQSRHQLALEVERGIWELEVGS